MTDNHWVQTGDMLFSTLLQHWSCSFKSKCTRISVSGNLEILNRDKLQMISFKK